VSPRWQAVIDRLFAGEVRHIVLHLLLFGGLTFMLFALFHLSWRRQGWLAAGLVVLLVGSLQELVQALTGASAATWSGALFDLAVDLCGAALGAGAWRLSRAIRRK
jgi:hypothetical protein